VYPPATDSLRPRAETWQRTQSMRAEWWRWHTRSCPLCGRDIGL